MIAEGYKENGGYVQPPRYPYADKEDYQRPVVNHYQSEGLKYDGGKLLMTLVKPEFVKGVAEVLTFGANKYAPNSWQTVPDAKRRYEDALYRHWLAYLEGEQLDNESGLEHLKHLACNAMFLLHLNKTKGN